MNSSTNEAIINTGVLPWTRSCLVCGQDNPRGFRLKSRLEHGLVVLDYTTRETDLGYRNIVHGGIAMTLLDEVMTWAAILSARQMCVAAELTTRLKEPITVGQELRVEAKVTRRKSRLLFTEGSILDDHKQLLVAASGKYLPMPREHITLCSKDFVASPEALDLAHLLGEPGQPAL